MSVKLKERLLLYIYDLVCLDLVIMTSMHKIDWHWLKKEGRNFFHDKNQDGGILEDEKKNFGSRVSEYSCQNFFKMAIF